MTRPGTRIRSIAARLFDAQTMERYVDPAVADLQTEYEEAVKRGRRRERARVFVVGYIGVIQVMSIQGSLRAIDTVREHTADDRRAILRTVLASAVVIVIAMMALIAPFMRESWSHPRGSGFVVYLIPQALPLSIPVGLTFGILWALGRLSASRTALVLVLVIALGASLVSFVTLAWIMPNANQAFRTATAGGPVAKGLNELTIGELRERINNPLPLSPAYPSAPRSARTYYERWALGATPFVLAMFAMIVATGRKSGRAMPFVLSPIVIVGFYTLMQASRGLELDRTLSPFVAAWTPNAIMLMLSAAVMSLRVLRRKRGGGAASKPSLA